MHLVIGSAVLGQSMLLGEVTHHAHAEPFAVRIDPYSREDDGRDSEPSRGCREFYAIVDDVMVVKVLEAENPADRERVIRKLTDPSRRAMRIRDAFGYGEGLAATGQGVSRT